MCKENNKVAVIYKSKYGSTKKYAEWIAEGTKGDLFESNKIKLKDLIKYDTIVYGGYLHAVGISGKDLITTNFDKLNNKKIIVFSVGCSPIKEENFKAVIESNFTDDIREKMQVFFLRGAFNYNKLNLFDKMLMSLLKRKIKSKKDNELNEDEKGLLASFNTPMDWTDKSAIIPIIEYINR